MTSELSRLLDAGTAFDAEYGASAPNHRSTALSALARLGADDARLVQWAKRYEAKLHPAPAAEPWPPGQAWSPRLGDPRAWPAYRSLFSEWIDNESLGDLLTPVLPQLMQGCAGAAFHGLNRLACAVQSARRDELVDALAYWACRWWPVSAAAAAAAPSRTRAGLSLQTMAARAAEAYARGGHRTALQLVNSAQAMRVLLPLLADEDGVADAALAAYRRAFDCAWAAVPLRLGAAPVALPWATLSARAVANDDVDILELVAACCDEHAAYGGAVWQQAATRAVASST